eukprot:TRINITY_DN61211_c0_g1_i1.p1 TRINITY_DN61211_c0_g1~~TRINITY_DN61211_c0_g1_i1.p1  ORF type:complete len:707 (+),score=114.53 TRINITY_DN61211_c0_g1_i1:60-2180(+)
MVEKPHRSFRDLVCEVEQEYEAELSRLRQENLWMRKQLGFQEDEALDQVKVLSALIAVQPSAQVEALGDVEIPRVANGTASEDTSGLNGVKLSIAVEQEAVARPEREESDPVPAAVHINGGVFEATQFTFETALRWHKDEVKLAAWENGTSTSLSQELTRDLQAGVDGADELGSTANIGSIAKFLRRYRLPMSPNAPVRLAWDVVGLMLISYDLFAIPLAAFEPPEIWFTIMMGWISMLFWTFDMIASLLVGYFDNGELVLDLKKILMRYLKTWFVPDLLVVLPDWFTRVVSTEGSGGLATATRALKGFRGIRILRLLRLLKLQRLMNMVYDLIDSEYMFIVFTMLRLILAITVLNHVIACIWYYVGVLTMKANMDNWLENTGTRNVYEADLTWRYLTSLHWSLTQFTPASMDVSARNVWERLMSILVLFFSLITFSSIVGSVTNSMTALRNMSGDTKKQFWMLRRFLNHKKVGKTTCARIIRFLEHQTAAKQGNVNASSIKILALLSEPLKNLLAYELSKKHVNLHPFFAHLENEMSPVLVKLCDTVLKSINLASEDVVFHPGEEGDKMYFVKSGGLEYMLPNGDVLKPRLRERAWLGEAVLWTTWWHRGEFKALTPSELAIIRPAPFSEVMKVHPRPWGFCRRYAQIFVTFLNSVDQQLLTDVLADHDFFEKAVVECDKDYDVDLTCRPTGSSKFPCATAQRIE